LYTISKGVVRERGVAVDGNSCAAAAKAFSLSALGFQKVMGGRGSRRAVRFGERLSGSTGAVPSRKEEWGTLIGDYSL
jgi:hypothetical protein